MREPGARAAGKFTGSITDSSCNVDSTSANQSVDLGKWASSYFTGAGSETTKTAFHIKVKDCPSTVTTVSVLFDGTRDTNNSDLLAINGTASGVAIKLYEDDKSTPVDLGAVSAATALPLARAGRRQVPPIWNSLPTMSQPARFPPVLPTVRPTSIWFTTNTLKAGKAAVIHGFPDRAAAAEIRAAALLQIFYQLQVVIPAFIIPGR